METAELTNTGFGNGEKLYQQRARSALPLLVRQAKAQQPIYYAALASELRMPNPRNLNFPLGAIGREIERLRTGGRFGKVPALQCLVINQQDETPGNGIGWFLGESKAFKGYSPAEKRRVMAEIFHEIYLFKYWDEVLAHFKLKPVQVADEKTIEQEARVAVTRRSSGEGDQHRDAKLYVSHHPEMFGLPTRSTVEVEYPLPSGDIIDVLFKHGADWVGVEVKGPISDDLDLNRGLFQCVKYQALLEAEQKILQRTVNVRIYLACCRELSKDLSVRRNVLNIALRRLPLT